MDLTVGTRVLTTAARSSDAFALADRQVRPPAAEVPRGSRSQGDEEGTVDPPERTRTAQSQLGPAPPSLKVSRAPLDQPPSDASLIFGSLVKSYHVR